MKFKILSLTLILFFIIFSPVISYCEIDTDQKETLAQIIQEISRSINTEKYDNIFKLLSEDMKPELKKAIEDALIGKKMKIEMEISSFEEMEDSKIKVYCNYSAKGLNWSVSGFSNFFTFKDNKTSFELVDTDFHTMGAGKAKTFIFIMLGVFAVVFLPMIGFWIFMFMDLMKNDLPDNNNKTLWVIILIGLNFAGAIIYFFMIKTKRNK